MRLIANRPCTFGGQKFKIGDEVPNELVANPKLQAKYGVLSISNGEAALGGIPAEELQEYTAEVGQVHFTVPIHGEDGDIELNISNEELVVFTDIQQIGVSKTEDKQHISDMIAEIKSEDLLIMLDALDGRKYVKEEVLKQVEILKASAEGENGGGE